MSIIGMGFNRIAVDRSDAAKGNLEVVHNVFISNVEKAPMNLGTSKSEALKFTFEFSVRYEPKAGNITLGGYVLFMAPPDLIKETMEKWDKEKKISKELTKAVLGHAFSKCNVEAAVLSKEVNLPPPFPIPRLKTSPEQK